MKIKGVGAVTQPLSFCHLLLSPVVIVVLLPSVQLALHKPAILLLRFVPHFAAGGDFRAGKHN